MHPIVGEERKHKKMERGKEKRSGEPNGASESQCSDAEEKAPLVAAAFWLPGYGTAHTAAACAEGAAKEATATGTAAAVATAHTIQSLQYVLQRSKRRSAFLLQGCLQSAAPNHDLLNVRIHGFESPLGAPTSN